MNNIDTSNSQILEIELENRQEFITLLKQHSGVIIIKFTAPWCTNCKKIDSYIHDQFVMATENSNNIYCFTMNVDNNFDLYAHLKYKKMVSGIPVLLCYKKGNHTYISDDSISGTDKNEIDFFFKRCKTY